jgi:leucyl aminopeptidase
MTLSISFSKKPSKADTAIIFANAKGALLPSGAALDKAVSGHISLALKAREGFTVKLGETLAVVLPKGSSYTQALVVGLGDVAKLETLSFETAGGKALPALKAIGAKKADILFDSDKAEQAAAFGAGLTLRDYSFDKYKSKAKDDKKKSSFSSVTIVTDASGAAKLFSEYEAVAQGVFLARDLVSEPANVLYPESYAAIISKELKPLGVSVEILDEKKMQKLGFGAHLAVGMGSIRAPRVVIMRWNGTGTTSSKAATSKKKAPIALVGKGVTFDTGGISIKPAAGMEEMKMDMGGSAAVVGAMKALATQKAKVDVIGIVGLAENMPSDRSYRPGDIVTSLSGKTIEVLNTDAEGRLVLCDALTYVQNTYKPSMIIDLATLTGAIMVALGVEYAGVFANDDTLWSQMEKAAKVCGEKIWRMPLDEAYRNEMRGTASDLQNLGNLGRYGGACSAAGFLEHFIEDGVKWAHIDIAGTAWWKSDKATTPKGATGYGVRLLYQLVSDNYAS